MSGDLTRLPNTYERIAAERLDKMGITDFVAEAKKRWADYRSKDETNVVRIDPVTKQEIKKRTLTVLWSDKKGRPHGLRAEMKLDGDASHVEEVAQAIAYQAVHSDEVRKAQA